LTWVDEAFLLSAGVQPWSELPLWVPAADAAAFLADVSRALAAGLRFRPIAETVRDTLGWARTWPADRALRAGLAPEREAELLRAWHAR
jgi:2'-hydroxyisoflavone reductase